MSRPRPLVLCGPSGSGKSTLLSRLTAEFPQCFGFSVSHTTRKPRPGEENGVHYNFVSRDEMEKGIENGDFIESAVFSGNTYGTSKAGVERVLATNKICVLDIDVQGVQSIKKTNLKPRYVFVKPPSMEILERRLRDRNTESEESLQKRLNVARQETEYGEAPGNFDIIIVNDNINEAYTRLRDFIIDDINALTSDGV